MILVFQKFEVVKNHYNLYNFTANQRFFKYNFFKQYMNSLTWNSQLVDSVINASITGMYLRFYEQHRIEKENKQYFLKLKYADKGRKVKKLII